ncbi:MAG: dTDP-4-dehydrorhamnose 3,5-epimerase [Nitrospirota bacterium]
MIFTPLSLPGACIVDIQPLTDDRGFFARSFCRNEFAGHKLRTDVVQCNISFNAKRGTLRGMHFQADPKAEAKLVRCTRGRIYDVIIDLRPGSATYCQWEAVEMSGSDRRALYVPEGFAHGFQTLEDETEVFYQMFEFFLPEHARGVRWDDPAFGIRWPLPEPIMSEKDRSYPLYSRQQG